MTSPLPARVNLITLGVSDLATSTRFYRRLGWRHAEKAGNESISFFALDNLVLGLWSRQSLAEDAHLPYTPPGFGGITLAINLPSEAAVDSALAAAVAEGGTLLKAAERVSWGGYSGYFADPDGHPWEIAFNPFFPLDEDGLIALPD